MHWSILLALAIAMLVLGYLLGGSVRSSIHAPKRAQRASLASTEAEVVLLKATTESIDSMVNFEVFNVLGIDPDANITFHTRLTSDSSISHSWISCRRQTGKLRLGKRATSGGFAPYVNTRRSTSADLCTRCGMQRSNSPLVGTGSDRGYVASLH